MIDLKIVDGEIQGTAVFEAPPEKVFRALTTGDEIVKWWGSDDTYRLRSWQGDLRPGGRWECEAVNTLDGHLSTVSGEVLEFDPPRRFAYTWSPSWETIPPTVVSLTLEPKGSGTLLRITHSGFGAATDACENHRVGWMRVLSWLREYVDGIRAL